MKDKKDDSMSLIGAMLALGCGFSGLILTAVCVSAAKGILGLVVIVVGLALTLGIVWLVCTVDRWITSFWR